MALNLALVVVVVCMIFVVNKEKDAIKELEVRQASELADVKMQVSNITESVSEPVTEATTEAVTQVVEPVSQTAKGDFASEWKGLKAAWYGDSLTELYYHCEMVNEYFGMEGYNCGIRGTSVAFTNEASMCLVERMTQGDKAIPADVDVIFIMAGTNDWCGNVPLGDKRLLFDLEGKIAVDNSTFYGACHTMFNNLTLLYPDAYILVLGTPFGSSNRFNIYNELGLTSMDYGDALCDAASMWGIPSFNIGEKMGINVNNVEDSKALMYEGIHFVEGGARMAADVIIQEMSGLKYYK